MRSVFLSARMSQNDLHDPIISLYRINPDKTLQPSVFSSICQSRYNVCIHQYPSIEIQPLYLSVSKRYNLCICQYPIVQIQLTLEHVLQ